MIASFRDEEWKQLEIDGENFSDRYKISNYGRVISYTSNTTDGKLMNPTVIAGYDLLRITYKMKKTSKYIHKLVARHFLPEKREDQKFVIHLDFDKTNNKYSNLSWASKSEMEAHQRLNPAYAKINRKGIIRNAKLNETEVIRLKKFLKRNPNTRLKVIAKQFGITHTQLNRIRSGENWGHVKID
ncbi:MAG: HNH endonuclease [Flavobacteriales bacterium]|nr:HNH endonuclease [Flavobacteriales bacterium]